MKPWEYLKMVSKFWVSVSLLGFIWGLVSCAPISPSVDKSSLRSGSKKSIQDPTNSTTQSNSEVNSSVDANLLIVDRDDAEALKENSVEYLSSKQVDLFKRNGLTAFSPGVTDGAEIATVVIVVDQPNDISDEAWTALITDYKVSLSSGAKNWVLSRASSENDELHLIDDSIEKIGVIPAR